jgi:HAE1 family hydrophobic/amphiphilic exporter-1
VDYTNELRRRGLPRDEAILEANRTRLRPILMTTLMLVAGMVPIALGQGPGAGARASMAKVIIGGQMLSLALALVVTPVIYVLLDQFSNASRRLRSWIGTSGRRPGPPPSDDAATPVPLGEAPSGEETAAAARALEQPAATGV